MEVETYTTKPAFSTSPTSSSYPPPETLHPGLEEATESVTTSMTLENEFLLSHECPRRLNEEKKETIPSPAVPGEEEESAAAVKVQKVYRSYRTRRRLADTAVVVEELWWQAIDFARLNHSTISFFNLPETAASRWSRISLNASKVGKGLSQDSKAQKLAFQHWIEAIDPRHRYGHNLNVYYDAWCHSNSGQPFFYWLDLGDGKNLDLPDCTRSKLRKQCIQYLGPQEREEYEYVIVEGRIINKLSQAFLDTCDNAKWIFVMSTCERLYVGEKQKGRFHHSSFLAGGATLAAGRLVAVNGVLKGISAYSGHYRPTDERLDRLTEFLKEKGVDLAQVEIQRSEDAYSTDNYDDKLSHPAPPTTQSAENPPLLDQFRSSVQLEITIPTKQVSSSSLASSQLLINGNAPAEVEVAAGYKRTLSGGLQSPKTPQVPKASILERINSKKGAGQSYQLGHRLSRKWSTGAGPRIGCVADYPAELILHALELNDLSPRHPCSPSNKLAPAAAASGFGAGSGAAVSATE